MLFEVIYKFQLLNLKSHYKYLNKSCSKHAGINGDDVGSVYIFMASLLLLTFEMRPTSQAVTFINVY